MIRNRRNNVKLGVVGLTAIATLVLAGCGGGGGAAPASSLVTGVASKGPLNGSTVCAFAITGGVKGASLGTCATGIVNGKYSINLGSYTGPVLFEATGGTYVDEATGATVALAAPLHSMLGGTTGGNTTAAITPLTELAYQDAISIASGLTAARISAAIAKVQTFFGVADIVKTLPVDALAPPATATAAEKTYALALASVSEYLKAQPAGTSLTNALTTMGACLAAPATGCGTGATAVDASLTAAKATFLAGHPGLGGAAAAAGGAGAAISCITAHYTAGAVRVATATELASYAKTYTGDTMNFSGGVGTVIAAGGTSFVFGSTGTLTYNGAPQTVGSICKDNTLPMMYVEFGTGGSLDLFANGTFTGFTTTTGYQSPNFPAAIAAPAGTVSTTGGICPAGSGWEPLMKVCFGTAGPIAGTGVCTAPLVAGPNSTVPASVTGWVCK